MKIRINVTKNDIVNGKKSTCHYCPHALAIQRRVKAPYYVNVFVDEIYIQHSQDEPIEYRILIPDRIQDWIWDFDNSMLVKPTSYTLDIPDKYLKTTRMLP